MGTHTSAAAQTAIDNLPCGWLRASASGRLLQCNSALQRLTGRDGPWPAGASLDDLLSGAARVLYNSYLLPLLRLHGRFEEFALSLRHAGGGSVDVLAYGHAVAAEDGGEPLLELVLVPMRERRRLEDELLRVKRAADAAPGLLLQIVMPEHGDGRMPYASEGLRGLYGLSPQAVAGTLAPWLALIAPEDRVRVQAGLRPSAVDGGGAWRIAFRVERPGRPLAWHELHAQARPAAPGTVAWHGDIADITARRAGEQALVDMQAAESASRAKSEFLARVSHELRTPLNGILGFAHLLRMSGAEPLSAEQRRRVEIIEMAGRNLLGLINDVLDVSRIEQGQLDLLPEALPLAPLLDDALRLVESQALAAGIALPAPDCASGLAVLADRRRLSQVLVNLLSNAVKYNRRGGHVALAAYVDTRADGSAVCIAVHDTGHGLDAAQRAQLFQPFNRLGAERGGTEGTGLGLVVTRNLVQLMDGRIEVDSNPGQGSVFRVWLPAVRAPAPAPRTPPAAGAVPPPASLSIPARQRRLIYVEDNPVNAMVMEAMFDQLPDLALQVVADGAALLQAALAATPDLLLLDLQLPDGDGIDWLQRLRAHPALAAVPVVVVSANVTPHDRARARAAGCIDYWTKPLDMPQALRRLSDLLAASDGPTAPA